MEEDRWVVQAEKERTARHYGRAYQCLRCLYRDGKEEIDVKRRMVAHITKYHLSLDQVGHYCRLCSFRCWDRKELDQHVVEGYGPHRKEARRLGKDPLDRQYPVDTQTAYRIGEADYRVLPQADSVEFFRRKTSRTPARSPSRKDRTPARTPKVDLGEDLLGEALRTADITEAETAAAFLENITSDEAGMQASERATVPSPTRGQELPGVGAQDEAQMAPLDLSMPAPQEENILGQLLGEDMDKAVSPRDVED